MMGRLASVALILLCCVAVRGGVQGAGDAGHGWIMGIPDGLDRSTIFHLPPRSSAGGDRGASPGTIRRAGTTRVSPIASAATDNRLVLVFEPEDAESPLPVRSLAVFPGPQRRAWIEVPPNRLSVENSLPIERERLLGLCGGPAGEVALVLDRVPSEDDVSAATIGLLLLTDDGWIPAELPTAEDRAAAGAPAEFGRSRLVQMPDGPGLFVIAEDGRMGLWQGEVAAEREVVESDEGDRQVVWSATSSWRYLPLAPAGDEPTAELGPVLWFGGRLIVFVREGGRWLIRSHSDQSVSTITRLEAGVPEEIACAPLHDVGTIGIVWAVPRPESGTRARGAADITINLVEISVSTGRIIRNGPPRLGGLMTRSELSTLALALIVMTAVMLMLLIGGGQKQAWTISQGFVLASHPPRVMAFVIDALFAALITSAILGIPLASAFAIDAVAQETGGEWGLLWTLGLAWAIGTLSEALTGRTLGKMVAGIGVTRIGDALVKPSLGQSAIRNACVWLAPQLAIFALLDPQRRHRGDEVSGTVVVQPVPAEGE